MAHRTKAIRIHILYVNDTALHVHALYARMAYRLQLQNLQGLLYSNMVGVGQLWSLCIIIFLLIDPLLDSLFTTLDTNKNYSVLQ